MKNYRRSSLQSRSLMSAVVAPSLFLACTCIYLYSYHQNSFAIAFISQHTTVPSKTRTKAYHFYSPESAAALSAENINNNNNKNNKRRRRFINNTTPPKQPLVFTTTTSLNSISNSGDDEDNTSDNTSSSSNNSQNDRMAQIRHIQRSFYQDEGQGVQRPSHGETILQDLPLWRVQWTELPGYQNVLNVHVPHYTNMFLKIINSKQDIGVDDGEHTTTTTATTTTNDRYFGHLFLPGGSENMDNDEYRLISNPTITGEEEEDSEDGSGSGSSSGMKKTKASLTGVLMKISDYKQLEDGRLMLIVQALERFRVVEVKDHHLSSPHAIATVEIIPDRELVETVDARTTTSTTEGDEVVDGGGEGVVVVDDDGEEEEEKKGDDGEEDDEDDDNHERFLPKAVDEAFLWHSFEARPVTLNECAVPTTTGEEAISVSPLINFDANLITTTSDDDDNKNKHVPIKKYSSLYTQTSIQRVMDLEYAVWVQLDELIHLLQRLIGNTDAIPQEVTKIPVPTQILGLLPRHPPRPWPSQFALEDYATRMERDEDGTTAKKMVGTSSRSLFVRADDMDGYPPLRRAQRLSYVIWILLDSTVLNVGLQAQDRQSILEMDSVVARLKAAQAKLEQIGGIIRQVLNEA